MLPLVTSIGVCPVDMGVDWDEVVTSTETCPVDMVVDCDKVVTPTETCPVDILTKVVVWRLVCPDLMTLYLMLIGL